MEFICVTGGSMDVNTYVVYAGAHATSCVLIDPGAPIDRIEKAAGDRQVAAVILTHAHFDHMLSAQHFLSAGARLYVGDADGPALTDDHLNLGTMVGSPIRIDAPAVLVRDMDTIDEAGLSLRVLHTPGHTAGGICLVCEGVLFAGDTMFYGSCGRTDFPGGDYFAMRKSLERLKRLPPETTVLCGHGPQTTIARERRSTI